MKKNLLITLFFISFINIIQSQVAIFKALPFMDTISQPGLRKFGLKFSFSGINVPILYKTETAVSSSVVYYGDSIPNLLDGSMSMATLASTAFRCTAINALNTNETYGPIFVYPVNENVISFNTISEPNGTNCDGYIQAYLDQGPGPNYDVSAQYDPMIAYNFSGVFGGFSSTMTNGFAGNLCSRKYRIDAPYDCFYSHDGNYYGMSIQESFIVLLGQYAFPSTTGFDAVINPYQQATSPSCNGKANVTITNSTASPFLYSYDGAPYVSSDSIVGLCEGIHTVKIKNTSDSIAKYFIISDTSNVFNNTNLFGSVVDTIIVNSTNCNFNYNLPVDSAFLVSHNQIDLNTIALSWQIWQSGTSTIISDTISYLYQSGNNMVSLMMFCGNAKTTNSVSIKTLRVNDYIVLNQTVGINEKQQNSAFEIFPNPFSNIISIKCKDIVNIKNIEITNLLGEKVLCNYQSHGQEISFITNDFKAGFYMISIISKSGNKSSYKVIKE
ncbi:MAG: T9SS type A sorting domain-containing protein [Bacteroidota bacterium]